MMTVRFSEELITFKIQEVSERTIYDSVDNNPEITIFAAGKLNKVIVNRCVGIMYL